MKVKNYKDKIVNLDEIEDICSKRRDEHRIVTTNGCFDILHAGHMEYLQTASECGDIFIVGINGDASVRRLKGEARPFNNEKSRASIIACLGFVDYCVIFSEDTPVELLQRVKPHIHIKGGDYKNMELPEKKVVEENGGIVKILPYMQGFSTTNIIKKIMK